MGRSDYEGGSGFRGGGYPSTRGNYGGMGRGRGGGGGGGGDYGGDGYNRSMVTTKLNPEYYDRESSYSYEGGSTRSASNFSDADPKRKIHDVTICIDYIRGYCAKAGRCPFPHTDYVESIDEREVLSKVKFCHDYQNKGVCQRAGCRFLHVTRREEDEFLLTGSIPESVFERMKKWMNEGNTGGGNGGDDSLYYGFGEDEGGGRGGFRGGGRGGGFRGRGGRGGGGFRGRGSGGGGFGGRGGNFSGGGYGQKRSYDSMGGGYDSNPTKMFRGRGGFGRGGGGPGKHSTSQPVTYGNICVDYLKGTCAKDGCQLSHLETIDDPSDRMGLIKQVFCHDFQNGTCTREFCKFIHASRQEEGFFRENGYFPPSMNARNRDKLFYSDICLDFLRSQCIRGASCTFRHVEKVEVYSERLCLSRSIFCHDYQEGNCTRYPCKMVHTSRDNERYFIETGYFPDGLRANQVRASNAPTNPNPNVGRIAENVCREFVKRQCMRGSACKFYHPTPQELEVLLVQQSKPHPGSKPPLPSAGGGGKPPGSAPSGSATTENTALKSRVNQLERLLADACYCMTLAVGDQNPAISSLMKTISDMAPESALANQADGGGGTTAAQGGQMTTTEP